MLSRCVSHSFRFHFRFHLRFHCRFDFDFWRFSDGFRVRMHYIFIKSNQRSARFALPLALSTFVCLAFRFPISVPWLGLFRQLNSYVAFAQFFCNFLGWYFYIFFSYLIFDCVAGLLQWHDGGTQLVFMGLVQWPVVGVADKLPVITDYVRIRH